MKRLLKFLGAYKLFSAALLVTVAGIGLQIAKQTVALHWLLTIAVILLVMVVLWNIWQTVRLGQYGVDLVTPIAIITALVLSQYWVAMLLVLLVTSSQLLKDLTYRQARLPLKTLHSLGPKTVQMIRKGKATEAQVSELKVGDQFVVQAGEVVPADGLIIEGSGNFDEAYLIGGSTALHQVGGHVLGGSLSLDGSVTVKATAVGEGSQLQRLIRWLKGAATAQTPFVRLTDSYCLPFTFLALGIAAAGWLLGGDAKHFLAVLVVATPLPFILPPTLAIMGGVIRASRYGIIFRSGAAVEKLTRIKAMAFTKTGTLTGGQMTVGDIKVYGGQSAEQVLLLAASLEQSSKHLVAQSIVEAAVGRNLKLLKVKHAQASPQGLKSVLKGQEIAVGSLSYMTGLGVKLPGRFKPQTRQSAVYVAADAELVGVINLSDPVRPEAEATMNSLKRMGIKELAILTGNDQTIAQATAQQLGIQNVQANLQAAAKIQAIEKFALRPIAFVGHNHKDGPALAAANLGIMLGANNALATSEPAGVIILADDLGHVAIAVALARRILKIARQSVWLGMGLSLALMLVFTTINISLLFGIAIRVLIELFSVTNALRASSLTTDI